MIEREDERVMAKLEARLARHEGNSQRLSRMLELIE
jgi:hypothetical protein